MKIKNIGIASIIIWSFSSAAFAAHSADSQADAILGDGNGIYLNYLTQSSTVHDWYTFDLNAGQTVTLELSTPSFTSHLFLFDVLDDNLEEGDILGSDYVNVANMHMSTGDIWSYTASGSTAGQLGLQIDSYVGGQGDYSLTISGAAIPEPASIGLLGLVATGIYFKRRFFIA